MKVKDFCKKYNITECQFYGEITVNHTLFGALFGIDTEISIPDGFNPNINGFLWLGSLKKLPLGFNPKVSKGLDLECITGITENFNPEVGTWLDLKRVTKIQGEFNPIVGSWLDLRSLIKLPKIFTPNFDERIFLNNDIICGDLHCDESTKNSLYLMLKSTDKELRDLAISLLWKYTTEDIKDIISSANISKINFIE